MEDLVAFAVDQVALEGPSGCSAARLVAVLEEQLPIRLPQVELEALHPAVLRQLWRLLLERQPRDLRFGELAPPDQQQQQQHVATACGRACPLDGVRSFLSPACGCRPASPSKAAPAQPQLLPLPQGTDLADWDALDKQRVRIMASQLLQDAALGLSCEYLTTSKLNPQQRQMLELCGRSRSRGLLRMEVMRALRVDASKVHYIYCLLAARGLLVSSPSEAPEELAATGTKRTVTSVLHLRRFAPRLGEGVVFKETGGGRVAVADDCTAWVRDVCARLEAAKDQTLLEFDLKRGLGFRDPDGHRAWRRVRKQLETQRLAEFFDAVLRGEEDRRARHFVRLLPPSAAGAAQRSPAAARGRKRRALEAEEEEEEGGEDLAGELIAEASLEWQVAQMVARAGAAGVVKHKLCRRLGLPIKKLRKRLAEVVERFGLVETDEQDGKQVVKLWRAPEWLQQQFRDQAFAGSAAPAATPSSAAGRAPSGQAAAVAGPSTGALSAWELQPEDLDMADASEQCLASPADAARQTNGELALDQARVTVVDVPAKHTHDSKLTSLAQGRMDALVRHVTQHGFLLQFSVLSVLLRTGPDAVPHTNGQLDKRTITRLVERGVRAGQLRNVRLQVASQRPGEAGEVIPVILAGGRRPESDPSLVAAICHAHKNKTKEVGVGRTPAAGPHMQTLEVTRLTRPPRKRPRTDASDDEEEGGGSSATASSMWWNGYIHARMIRARLLHTHICRLVGLAGDPGGPRNVSALVTPEGSGDAPGEQQAAARALAELAGEQRGAFTFNALWSALPLDVYAQAIGTAVGNPAMRQLLLTERRMGELSREEVAALADVKARQRVAQLLDLLSRMGLLQPLGGSQQGPSPQQLSKDSAWLVLPTAAFEQPQELKQEESGEPEQAEAEALRKERKEFDLREAEQLEQYWGLLEAACIGCARMPECWPAGRSEAPEMLSHKAWGRDRLMPLRTWFALRDRVTQRIEAMGWREVEAAAAEFGLEYARVQRIVNHMRAREAQLRRRADPTARLPRLRGTGRRLLPGKQPRSKDAQRALLAQRHQERTEEWRRRLPSKSRAPTLQRPWDPADLDASRAAAEASEDEGEREAREAEEAEGEDAAIPRRLARRRQLLKKHGWRPEEDRYLLQFYVQWHAVQGFKQKAFRSQERPMKGVAFRERQAMRRVKELTGDQAAAALMARLNATVEEVWRRAHDRGGGELGLQARMDELRRRRDEEKQEARRAARVRRRAAEAVGRAGLPVEEPAAERAYGALVVPFPQPPPDQLFVVEDERDARAQDAARGIIEQIVAVAPRRVTDDAAAAAARQPRQRKRPAEDGASDAAAAKRQARGPLPTEIAEVGPQRRPRVLAFETLEQQLQRLVSKRAQSRARLLAAEEAPPSPAVAAAAELIKSLLSASGVLPDAETALVRRFSGEQISAAFAHLRRRNFVFHGGSRRPFCLTDDFQAALEVAELPEDVFREAQAAAADMRTSAGGLIVPADGSELPSGLVAEALSLLASGALSMALPQPPAGAGPTAAAAKPLHPIDFSLGATLARGEQQLPAGLAMQPAPPEQQPEPVAAPADAAATLAACMAEAEAAQPGSGELLERAFRALQEAGPDGPSLPVLATQLGSPQAAAQAAASRLLAAGLAVRVPGYADWVLVAAEHAAPFFTDPDQLYTGSFVAQPEGGGAARPAGAAAAGQRGCLLLAPWLDHKGGLNAPLWARLVSRLASLVVTQPGVSEEELVAEMAALTPCSTKRLLALLVQRELLLVQVSRMRPPGPPAFLCAAPPAPAKEARHFFLSPRHSFSAPLDLSPFG